MRELLEIEITKSDYSIEEIMAFKKGLCFHYAKPEVKRPLIGAPHKFMDRSIYFDTQEEYMVLPEMIAKKGDIIFLSEDSRGEKKIAEGIVQSKYYEKSKKEDFRINTPLNEKNGKTFETNLKLSTQEKEFLTYGLMSLSMDDKWFMFMENNTIHYYRSWTGIEFFRAQLTETENGNWQINEVIVSKEVKKLTLNTIGLFKDLVKNHILRMKRIMD